MSVLKEYYAVALDKYEARLRSMDVYNVSNETESVTTVNGSDDDPCVYVLYDTEAHRDAAYQAFNDLLNYAVAVHSPFRLETENGLRYV